MHGTLSRKTKREDGKFLVLKSLQNRGEVNNVQRLVIVVGDVLGKEILGSSKDNWMKVASLQKIKVKSTSRDRE